MSTATAALLPPCRALAWKELRTHALLAGLAMAGLAVVAAAGSVGREFALFAGVPGLATLFGGAALGSERSTGTHPFLAARPVPAIVRDAVHFAVALALTALAWVSASLGATLGSSGGAWLDGMELPARLLLPVSAAFTLAALCIAYAAGALIGEALAAALAGLVVTALWSTLVLGVLSRLGGGLEQGLASLAPALLALALPPVGAALAAILRSGEGPVGPRAGRPLRRAFASAGVAALLGLASFAAALPPVLDARAVRLGRGEALDSPVLSALRGRAVAFVARSPRGATHAVVLQFDVPDGRAPRLVLPRGTVPVGWAEGPRALLLVAWPEGVQRFVEVSWDSRFAPEEESALALSTLGAGPFRVEGGTLFRVAERTDARQPLFPAEVTP